MAASWELPLFKVPGFDAGQNLSANYSYPVQFNGSGQLVLPTVAGSFCLGVVRNKPLQGQTVELWTHGVCPVVAGAAVTIGQQVTCNASGQLVPAVAGSGNHVLGIAMTPASAAGSMFSVLLTPGLVA